MSMVFLIIAVVIILFAVAVNFQLIISLGPLLLPLAIILAIILYFIYGFNRMIDLNRRVKNAWAQIDVQLKKRSDLVPNLVETVKGYAAHEKQIMESVTKAREAMLSAKDSKKQAQASDLLSGALKSVFALAENYPQLKANENFRVLQEQLEGLESKIAFSRQYYNDSVTRYNTAISSFPSSLFAKMMGYKEGDFPLFEAAPAERAVPKVKF